jgi:MFS family permease
VGSGDLSIFTGFGFGGVLVTTTTVMMEEWPAKTRAIFVGILSISIPVGIFLPARSITLFLPGVMDSGLACFHCW